MNINRIKELFQEEDNITKTARRYAEEQGIEYSDSLRRTVSNKLKGETVDKDLDNDTTTESIQYKTSEDFNMPSAWDAELQKFLTIEEYCDKYGLDKGSVKSSKLITHNQSNISYNIAFFTQEEAVVKDLVGDLDSIIQKYIQPVLFKFEPTSKGDLITRAIYTDQHIGMEINEGGNSLYGGKWDREELMKRGNVFSNYIIQKAVEKASNILYIDNLGDTLDGWNAQTTRGGHPLPQNMTNSQAFDLAIEFTLSIIDSVVQSGQFSKIICNNICNDNHSGEFGYILNSAIKSILENRYKGLVECNNFEKFINHYGIGKHCFLISHGKDKKHNRFGLKVFLDPVAKEKIDQYIKQNSLYTKYSYFELSKGDSHQMLFDYTTSDDFDYMNYPAFSPSSEWVVTNFKKGKSGFVLQTFNENYRERELSYKFFDWID